MPKFNSLLKMPEAAHRVGNENWYQQVYSKMPIWALCQKACGFFLRSSTCSQLWTLDGVSVSIYADVRGGNYLRQRAKIYVCLVHSCVEKFKKHKYTHLCLSSLMKKLAGKEHRRESQQKKVVYLSKRTDTWQHVSPIKTTSYLELLYCYSRMNYHWRKTWWQHLKNMSATTTEIHHFSFTADLVRAVTNME